MGFEFTIKDLEVETFNWINLLFGPQNLIIRM